METIDIKQMFNNTLKKEKYDLISKNIEHEFVISFWGYAGIETFPHVSNDLYIVPLDEDFHERNILTSYNERTYYGKLKMNRDEFYHCDLDKIPESTHFIDIFGRPGIHKYSDTFVLTLKHEVSDIGYYCYNYKYNFQKDNLLFLGRFARVDKNAWKFHPIFRKTSYWIKDIEKKYISKDFLPFMQDGIHPF